MRAADAVPGEALCDVYPVNRVDIVGNKVTRQAVFDRELAPMAGRACSLDDIVDGTQAIMDLRLFKSVRPELVLDSDGLVVRYTVEEKIYFLPIPRFSRTSDGELRWGLQLRWDNFRGLHHRVKLTTEQRKHESDSQKNGQVHRFSYDVPRFLGSRMGMSLSWLSSDMRQEMARDGEFHGVSKVTTDRMVVSFSQWLNARSAARGLALHAGLSWTQRGHQIQSGSLGPFEEGQDLSLVVGLKNRQESDDLFRLRGFSYGATFGLSSRALGSDYTYNHTDLYFVRYLPVGHGGLQNLNYRFQLGYTNGGAFGERRYSLGGGDLHRGLKPGSKDGDVLTLFNVEYLSAFYRYPSLRWVVFSDIGNVQRHNKFDPTNQIVGFGAGLRWKLLSLSSTDLRIDVAWSRKLDKPRFYLATKLTF